LACWPFVHHFNNATRQAQRQAHGKL